MSVQKSKSPETEVGRPGFEKGLPAAFRDYLCLNPMAAFNFVLSTSLHQWPTTTQAMPLPIMFVIARA